MGSVVQGFVDAFRHRAFVVAIVVLGGSALGLEWAVDALGVQFRKRALPLRRPLTELDANRVRLRPYEVRRKMRIPDEVVNGLGTDKYIQWSLEDTTKPPGDPHKHAILFITYYTGKPDQVPHVPEVCYQGGGYAVESIDNKELDIPTLGEANREVPVRLLRFVRSKLGVRRQPPVVYTFHSNGVFCGGRTAVRAAMANPFERYGYFSKVEVAFYSPRKLEALGAEAVEPPVEETVRAMEALLRVVLPLLVERHWPDWARREGTAVGSDTQEPAGGD